MAPSPHGFEGINTVSTLGVYKGIDLAAFSGRVTALFVVRACGKRDTGIGESGQGLEQTGTACRMITNSAHGI